MNSPPGDFICSSLVEEHMTDYILYQSKSIDGNKFFPITVSLRTPEDYPCQSNHDS